MYAGDMLSASLVALMLIHPANDGCLVRASAGDIQATCPQWMQCGSALLPA